MISKRRRTDDEDDLSFLFGSLPAPTQVPADETDELGRVVSTANPVIVRRDRIMARGNRRLLRRAQAQTPEDEEGYSTDASLSPSDAVDYETAMKKLGDKGKDVLSDVRARDFKNPELGLSKWFGEWRQRFSDSYTGAWGGLGMVGGWEFWTRLEMLGWNPLEVNLFVMSVFFFSKLRIQP